jgi:hypothetical protein
MAVWRHMALPIARRLRRRWEEVYDGALDFLERLA